MSDADLNTLTIICLIIGVVIGVIPLWLIATIFIGMILLSFFPK